MIRNSKILLLFSLVAAAAALSLTACGKPPAKADSPAARAQQAQAEKIGAIEKDLARLDQMIAQSQQQQQDALTQARDQSRRLAEELAQLRQSLDAGLPAVNLPEVPDESPSVLVVKSGGGAAPAAAAEVAARAPAARPATGPSFFGRLFLVIVLLAIVFLIFKALNRWQELEPEDAGEPDEVRLTPEGAISLSASARRQGADLGAKEDV